MSHSVTGRRVQNIPILAIFFLCFYLWEIRILASPLSTSSSASAYNPYIRPGTKLLHIGGIYPIKGTGGWQGGQACMPASMLALHDVNKKPDLIPGYSLYLHWNDSECEPGLGASVMYDLLYKKPFKHMLLAGCSTVCTTVSEAAKIWNLVVLCYGASSPALSNRIRFPTLFRTHPSATVHNPTRVALMKRFKWSKVAIIQQAEEVFISTVEDLEERFKNASIEIVTRQSFLSDPAEAVRNLKRQDARIVVGLFYVVGARRVLCESYKQELYGKRYVWFFIGWYEDNWFTENLEKENINCTKEQMTIAAEGHLTTESLMWNQNKKEQTISGMTSEDFRDRLDSALKKEGYDIDNKRYPEGYQEAPLSYDAIWSLALAFNKTIVKLASMGKKLEEFTYTNKEIAEEIYAAMEDTEFTGVSGRVAFSSKGDRIALTQIEQMINGTYNLLGYHDIDFNNITWVTKARWFADKGPPPDRTLIIKKLRTVSLSIFISMSIVAAAGTIWAISLIVFNYIFKHRRVIQLSHPVTNTLMLIGHMLCFISVFLVGLDGYFIPVEYFRVMCSIRKWVLSLGFTLAFGAMFSKVWRVHRLTTKNKSEKNYKIQPWKLYLLVATLVGLDVIFLSVWTIFDPLNRNIEKFPLEEPLDTEDDIKYLPQLEHCVSKYNNIWLGITYSFKGLLLIFGLFLAYETRSLKVRHINDSRLVAMAIYNVAVLCLITTPVTMVISSQQDASFAFVALAVIFSSMITMGLVFVPKIIEIVREGNERSDRSSAPLEAGTTKEEEEKYQKLLGENEQLRKILEQKEERLHSLRQKLEEKNALRKLQSEEEVKVGSGVVGKGGGGGGGVGGGGDLAVKVAFATGDRRISKTPSGKVSLVGVGGGCGSESGKNNNVEHIEVLETYYMEPSAESGIGQGLSVQTTDFELSESYL